MINIFLVDDHAIIREGLKRIISKTDDIIIVGEATNSEEMISQVLNPDWHADLVLLDITLPGRSGIDLLKQLKVLKPNLKFLVLSIHSEDQYALRALRCGASGYMTKDSVPEQLTGAIRKIHSGGMYISSSLAEKLAGYVGKSVDQPRHNSLSDREYQVMCLLASGKTVTEIAKELVLSVKTISTNRSRVLEKMGMRTNAQLTYYAIQNKLIE
ncbi:MAG: response regulator transcription factor [Candidatus Marinimicrobia bacterium]|nr:response regulator transcription factor [Candidatus Neomarinimicrobiota bacterium]